MIHYKSNHSKLLLFSFSSHLLFIWWFCFWSAPDTWSICFFFWFASSSSLPINGTHLQTTQSGCHTTYRHWDICTYLTPAFQSLSKFIRFRVIRKAPWILLSINVVALLILINTVQSLSHLIIQKCSKLSSVFRTGKINEQPSVGVPAASCNLWFTDLCLTLAVDFTQWTWRTTSDFAQSLTVFCRNDSCLGSIRLPCDLIYFLQMLTFSKVQHLHPFSFFYSSIHFCPQSILLRWCQTPLLFFLAHLSSCKHQHQLWQLSPMYC